MSFILDALKKSENQRQRQIGPSFADVRVSRHTGEKPWWAVAVGALLVVNLAVLLVVLMRKGDDRPAAAATAPTDAPVASASPHAPAARPGTQAPLPASASRLPRSNDALSWAPAHSSSSLADEATVYEPAGPIQANPSLAAAAQVPEGPPLVRAIEAPSVAPVPAPARSQPGQVQHEEVLPTMDDVTGRGTSLPEMHVDIHVYSNNPAERFVFINMRKYTEGQTLSEGPALERITNDGVVLNHRGVRFTLPRR